MLRMVNDEFRWMGRKIRQGKGYLHLCGTNEQGKDESVQVIKERKRKWEKREQWQHYFKWRNGM